MSDSDRSIDAAVERLVAGQLDHAAQRIDTAGLLERVRRSRQLDAEMFASPAASEAPVRLSSAALPDGSGRSFDERDRDASGERRRWADRLSWPLLAALVLLATFLGGRQIGPPAANASLALRDLQSVHRGEVDRCYRVQYAPDPRFWDDTKVLEGPSHSLLWTRGDRFWSDCTIADIRLRIGRQEDGTLWVSRSPQHGIRFTDDPSQLPEEVALLCAVNAMTVPRLVEEVLADFDLRADPAPTAAGPAAMVVWAALKPGRSHGLISSALLELDPETHVLTRLVLWMIRDGQPRGTVTYTLLESGTEDDSRYQLEAHLADGAELEHHRFKKAEQK
jgi:hypothetical protein